LLLEILGQWPLWLWFCVVAALGIAAVAHGAIGFGFPLISTPVVALLTDVRTAVLTTLLPNIVLNIISVLRGAQWRQTLRRHGIVAAYVLLGTLLGTLVLSYADPNFLKALLASLIVVHLLVARMARGSSRRWHAYPRAAPLVFGTLGGFFSGTVNVAVPPLLMYFSSLELPPLEMTQALNLSFLVGRSTQAAALALSGKLALSWALLSVPLSVLAVVSLALGFRLQPHIRQQTLAKIVRGVLWTMALTLYAQAGRAYLS